MSIDAPGERLEPADSGRPPQQMQEHTLPIYVEELDVSHRRISTSLVRATRTTRNREQLIEEDLTHERVEVERIPIGRVVTAVPPVREEGDTTILSVVEEVVVVERRLVLKEEVHFRRVKTTERHAETVVVREQDVAVTRTPLEGSPARGLPSGKPTPLQPKDELP